MYRFPVCLLAILALCGFRPAPPLPPPMPVALSLVDRDSGEEATPYLHRGQQWVAGTPGHRYAVRLRNLSGERVLVVLSVDGVNAISGQTAAPDQAGYVLEPWQDSEITGWRKSSAEVAQFVFTDRGDSYASRTGRPADVGVVGIAVFAEARPLPIAAAPAPRPAPLHGPGARWTHRHRRPLPPAANASNWAPAMAGARHRPATPPSSSAPATRPSRSPRSATTRGRAWYGWASCQASAGIPRRARSRMASCPTRRRAGADRADAGRAA